MQNVILVIHILACIAMTVLVLLQRSEGGALGIGGGGGGGGGGLISGRGAAGALVRTTIIFGAVFFLTSLTLTTIASRDSDTRTNIERELEAAGTGPDRELLDPTAPLLDEPAGDPLSEGPETPAPAPATGDPLAEGETPQPVPGSLDDPLAEQPPAETPDETDPPQ